MIQEEPAGMFFVGLSIIKNYKLLWLVLAGIHTLIALFLLNFLVIHLYMTTTGHSLFSHIAGMITGWEQIYETTQIADWETQATKKK